MRARKSRATSSATGATFADAGAPRSYSTCGVIMRARNPIAARRACTPPTGSGTCKSTPKSSIRTTRTPKSSRYPIRYSFPISRTSTSSRTSSPRRWLRPRPPHPPTPASLSRPPTSPPQARHRLLVST